VVWTTNTSPADNLDSRDGALKPVWSGTSHNKDGGSVLRFVDFPPHVESPMHRTQSIDYGIVISGEIEVHLQSGSHRVLKQSDVCVQRGTNHLWKNTTDNWTRVAFVLLDAAPILINGKPLADEGFPDGHK
jgi:quercetin dioxygenase-like cupin family protein